MYDNVRGEVEILYPNDTNLVPKSHHRHTPESFPAPKNRVADKTKTSKIDIKVVKDPLRVEQYLRKHDKRKVYDCIRPDVHALESRVFVKEQNSSSSTFKP